MVNLKTDNSNLYSYTLEIARYNHLSIVRNTEDLYGEDWRDETMAIQTYYESQFLATGAKIHYIQFRLPAKQVIKELPDDIQ
jgi:tRNA (guanine-N7-)-methyltransferase